MNLCERCGEKESTGWMRLADGIYWLCSLCFTYEDRKAGRKFGEAGDGKLLTKESDGEDGNELHQLLKRSRKLTMSLFREPTKRAALRRHHD